MTAMGSDWTGGGVSLNDGAMLLNNAGRKRMVISMKNLIIYSVTALVLSLSAQSADAACFADYKAKKDNPLQLHYGVVELPDAACRSRSAAASAIAPRLQRSGWTLLSVLSVFGSDGLEGRKANAGRYFLRF
jgi:hypothetical protein